MPRPIVFAPTLALTILGLVHGCSDSDSNAISPDAGFSLDAQTRDVNSAPDAIAEQDSSLADAGNDSGVDSGIDSGPPNGALVFDGVDDQLVLPAAVGAASETAFTAELWFKGTTATAGLFEVYGSGADRMLSLNSGKVCFYVYGPPVQICSVATTYNDGAWHHAAGTIGATGIHLYVDGQPAADAAKPIASTFTADVGFSVGAGHVSFNSAIYPLAGVIDEVRVWIVERSPSDILANYKQHILANTAGLQGYWKLDGSGSDATAHDETAGAHDGTLKNFVFTPTSPWMGPGAF